MAITIDPMTYVINVPKADMSIIQSSPEVRELDVDAFRLELRALEDNQAYNMCMLKTHDHYTEVTISGDVYPRMVIVLDPYTVEFEDGQYTVKCTGANHNLVDVKVANQVSLIVGNSFGLIASPKITELWQLQGLDSDNPMTVTPTTRVVGDISQAISGDGETTTTVTRS